MTVHDRPCAAEGLISYRCQLLHGFVMIGARDDEDALREAKRSTDHASADRIERWDGQRYTPATPPFTATAPEATP